MIGWITPSSPGSSVEVGVGVGVGGGSSLGVGVGSSLGVGVGVGVGSSLGVGVGVGVGVGEFPGQLLPTITHCSCPGGPSGGEASAGVSERAAIMPMLATTAMDRRYRLRSPGSNGGRINIGGGTHGVMNAAEALPRQGATPITK
ncbi:MAG TPA: hypothetical protein VLA76_06575 [Candidatus Angelobacter sp.]|nr:hypothetical protein [Candidatus Angelobacter sp.]